MLLEPTASVAFLDDQCDHQPIPTGNSFTLPELPPGKPVLYFDTVIAPEEHLYRAVFRLALTDYFDGVEQSAVDNLPNLKLLMSNAGVSVRGSTPEAFQQWMRTAYDGHVSPFAQDDVSLQSPASCAFMERLLPIAMQIPPHDLLTLGNEAEALGAGLGLLPLPYGRKLTGNEPLTLHEITPKSISYYFTYAGHGRAAYLVFRRFDAEQTRLYREVSRLTALAKHRAERKPKPVAA